MSEIIVDELKGKTSTGDITVTSEGGAATQSLQQGLAKAWMNEEHAVVNDSLNVSSATDGGSGDTVMNFTNNMNNANYYNGGGGLEGGSPAVGTNANWIKYHASLFDGANKATSSCNPRKGQHFASPPVFGDYLSNTIVFGDLA